LSENLLKRISILIWIYYLDYSNLSSNKGLGIRRYIKFLNCEESINGFFLILVLLWLDWVLLLLLDLTLDLVDWKLWRVIAISFTQLDCLWLAEWAGGNLFLCLKVVWACEAPIFEKVFHESLLIIMKKSQCFNTYLGWKILEK